MPDVRREGPNSHDNTFSSIVLKPEDYRNQSFDQFLKYIFDRMDAVKTSQDNYYRGLRNKEARWANAARTMLAAFGALAFLLTALAACLRFGPDFSQFTNVAKFLPLPDPSSDRYPLLLALIIYGVMGAIAVYERGTDRTNSYFRHIAVTLGIRDLWNKLQFDILNELTALQAAKGAAGAEQEARAKIITLAQTFINDLGKISSTEAADWKTAFLASLTTLNEVATNGSQSIAARGKELAKADEAADTAKVEIELNGSFEGEADILVDGDKIGQSNNKTFEWDPAKTGTHKIAAQAANGHAPLQGSKDLEVRTGSQKVLLTLQ